MTAAPLAPIHHVVQPYARFVVAITPTTVNVYDLNVSHTRPMMTDTLSDALSVVAARVRAGEYASLIGLSGKARRIDFPNTAKEQ